MRVCEGLLRQRVDNRDLLIAGGVVDSRSPAVVEIYYHLGFDFLLVDKEHSCLGDDIVANHIAVARCLGFPSMVRVVEPCYHQLNRALDCGADGVFVPRIRSREQVENIVRTVKYKPEGVRGLCGGGAAVSKYGGWGSLAEQIETVNQNTIVGIQIETLEAIENLDDILSVKGLDIAVVGNDDLSISMGMPGQTSIPEYVETVERVIRACERYGVLPGTACGNVETAVRWIERGMRCIWYSSEVSLFYSAASQAIHSLRELTGAREQSGA